MIATRALRPGDRLPSIRRLGAKLGIHHHTVRDAYHHLDSRGLIAVRHGAGATVREFSSLQLSGVQLSGLAAVGVLVAGFNPFYVPFLRGVERGNAEARTLTVVSVTEDNPVKARLQIDQLVAGGVRGIIAASSGQLLRDEVGIDTAHGPVRVVYCDQPDQRDDSIVFDGPTAGYKLAAHLAGHGHRRVTLMTPSLDMPNMAALHRGFLRAVQKVLIEAVDVLPCDGFSVEAGTRAATSALTSPVRPTAIATVADELALGVLASARRVGLRVPEELAVVSYGEVEAAKFVEPPLTTTALPAEEMGLLAARRMAARVGGEPAHGCTAMKSRLVVRRSCGSH
jgi:GntR family transcriptional regulator, arabinose operon transcriptional repressor